ncbi:formylglycine-generating enzyme family protein [Desulfosarcina sp. OttesenSCG-928-B08]|nr:formylglycine-generating enzyme family protein [Desulfosarcina sp. OttesenSCG-928-B08]
MKKAFVPFLSLLLVFLLGGLFPGFAQEKTHTNSIGMEFVLIPAGSFKMGCNRDFENCHGGESPQHSVTISKPFYLGKYEVTQEQWVAVMGGNPSKFKGRSNPVEQVSWNDVQTFIRKLNEKEKTGKYRLPTEAEWEYAARAGSTSTYSFGDDADQIGRYAWYEGNSGEKTHPVGQKQPNNWGLYDMHGNVWEWCQDWYGENYYRNSSSSDPKGPSSGEYRVNRGGGWGNSAGFCRSALRSSSSPGDRSNSLGIGFRLAFSPGRQ